MQTDEFKIGVVGLGYVGLPVAAHLAQKFKTLGFDIQSERVEELQNGVDRNADIDLQLLSNPNIQFTANALDLKECNFFIIAVPTPVDNANRPDLKPLKSASELVGSLLKEGDVVVYESTVYPGATEEFCLPLLEKASHLKSPEQFQVGYSPERINPGDPNHNFKTITKVVSAQNERSLARVAFVYESVVEAGIFKASNIKVAEAAKVIENTQRDLNIAFMNELAMIFERMGIDTIDVLKAAQTKWNFVRFTPGLVGGHCIGVDPYYLTYKAEQLKYHPQVILSGRRINDGMGRFVAQSLVKEMIRQGQDLKGATVSVFGLSFKPNVKDVRNTRVVDIVEELQSYGLKVQVCDPIVDRDIAWEEYGLSLVPLEDMAPADAVVLAVAHDIFRSINADLLKERYFKNASSVLYDVQGLFDSKTLIEKGIVFRRL